MKNPRRNAASNLRFSLVTYEIVRSLRKIRVLLALLASCFILRFERALSCFVFGSEWAWWITNDSERWKVMMQRDVACLNLALFLVDNEL
jgi:hypothetical protein